MTELYGGYIPVGEEVRITDENLQDLCDWSYRHIFSDWLYEELIESYDMPRGKVDQERENSFRKFLKVIGYLLQRTLLPENTFNDIEKVIQKVRKIQSIFEAEDEVCKIFDFLRLEFNFKHCNVFNNDVYREVMGVYQFHDDTIDLRRQNAFRERLQRIGYILWSPLLPEEAFNEVEKYIKNSREEFSQLSNK